MTSITNVATTPRRFASRHRPNPVAWLLACLLAERPRWSLWLPVGFGAGIAVYFALPLEPPWWLGSAVLAAVAAAAGLLRRRLGIVLVLLVCAVVAAGFGRAQLRTLEVAAPVLEKTPGSAAPDRSGRDGRAACAWISDHPARPRNSWIGVRDDAVSGPPQSARRKAAAGR